MQVSRSPIARVHQRRRHRRVDAARQPADRRGRRRRPCARIARDRLVDERPPSSSSARSRRSRNRKLREDLAAARRVRDLGVELHAVELARRRRATAANGAVGARRRSTSKPGGQRLDAVAVAHPDRRAPRRPRSRANRSPSARRRCTRRRGRTRAGRPASTLPPSSWRDQLHAVADAEDRHARARRPRCEIGGAPAS